MDGDELDDLMELETFERGGCDLMDGLRDARDPADVEALVVEACRVKDRLDRLNKLVTFDSSTWASFELDGEELVIKLDNVLREQRQTEIVFKQLLAEIARRRSEYDSDDDSDEQGGLSDL